MDSNQSQAEPFTDPRVGLGLLLVGHGTRDPQGLEAFRNLHQLVAERAGKLPVEACFLELAEPDIKAGIEALLERGAQQIVIAPLLLFAAGHAKRDIPEGVAEALRQLSETDEAARAARIVAQLPPLAYHAKLLALSAMRYREAKPLGEQGRAEDIAAEDTTLILVGRGSSDAEAQADMFHLGQLRAEQLPGVKVEVCFYALAEPKLEAILAQVAKSTARRVVVQPHLLFAGEVQRGIELQAEKQAALAGDRQQWWLCLPLGPDRRLAAALRDLLEAALRSIKKS